MTERARLILITAGTIGLAGLLLCTVWQLPGFGNYPGPYGDLINALAPYERHVTNAVAAVNFDYRALDTLGEEFILFGAVSGLLLLLRGKRGESPSAQPQPIQSQKGTSRSDAVRWLSFGLIAITNLFGIYMVIHGHLSPGGGFQGGAVLGTASMLVYLATGYRTYLDSSPKKLIEFAEAMAAAGYALIGILGMLAGGAFLQNVLPLGRFGNLLSGGTIPVINFAVGLEVSAGFTILFI